MPKKRSSKPVPVSDPATSSPPTVSFPPATSSSSSTNPGPYPGPSTSGTLKQRRPAPTKGLKEESEGKEEEHRKRDTKKDTTKTSKGNREEDGKENGEVEDMSFPARNRWIVYAVASGACAAFNGVFAKLTTDGLTAHIARSISGFLGLESGSGFLEVIVRGAFFGLNIVFNIIMWTLFTQALAKGNSTTQVSIMNTSTNFMISALLGLAIFAESLPPLWWAGAALLVAGNVILGRKAANSPDEVDGDVEGNEGNEGAEAAERGEVPDLKEEDEVDEDVPLLGDLGSSTHDR
ncbi:hypothetical protein F4678DRAFT_112445 [Xylaria arbuscula]|nr:hypothetical protein F4678DRAFT_112445 [Xylaria arbuscula]